VIANTRLFWALAGFFLLADITYIIWNVVYDAQNLATDPSGGQGAGNSIEWVGTVGLTLTAVLAAFIAFYLGRIHSAQGGELPEDRVSADIDDGDPEMGFFSPFSWWPMVLAAGLALLFMGVAVSLWMAFVGIAIVGLSVVGLLFEYYRGNFAH
jgi:hypothetical protein